MEQKGYIQVYTGNGKGKTTAALGLALRAAGREKKVYIAQFLKQSMYGEHIAIKQYLAEFVTIQQFGLPEFHYTKNDVTAEERNAAMEGIAAVKKAIAACDYDIVILDEANMAAHFKIIDIKYFLEIIDNKPENLELILTGRSAPDEFIQRADLVTEMKEIKHYYTKKVQARIGIEK
ncbi:MAG: cob(I)yrinic acid a,c-diamide adenosyltransferase [bacterium]|nr:cob(I)yrinic acid a,c-diamide adenosyltransferase [bacterium]